MAGNFRSGRLPKPPALHVLEGTHRRHRHGDRAAVVLTTDPHRPDGLNNYERWLWDLVMREYKGKGVLSTLDTALLLSACQLWGLYRESVKVAKQDPTDKVARTAVTSYWAAFERAAERLGLNPVDRSKLHTPKQEAPKVSSRRRTDAS